MQVLVLQSGTFVAHNFTRVSFSYQQVASQHRTFLFNSENERQMHSECERVMQCAAPQHAEIGY